MIARVVVDAGTLFVDRIFDYAVPRTLLDSAAVGVRVEVPFGAGNKRYVGFIIALSKESSGGVALEKIKDICAVIDDKPLFTRQRLLEAYWLKTRYFCTFADALKLFLPQGAKTKIKEYIGIYSDAETGSLDGASKKIVDFLRENGKTEYDKIKKYMGRSVRSEIRMLCENKILFSELDNKNMSADKFIAVVAVSDFDKAMNISKKAPAQRRIINVMSECEFLSIPDLCMFAGCTRQSVNALIQKGILEKRQIEVFRTPHHKKAEKDAERFRLTREQENVLSVISEETDNPQKPVLLHGVTGSGKTEVFIRAIEKILKMGKSAIVLVPEISLTYQMMSRFIARFGHEVALLHSSLSDGERFDEWKRIRNGNARVVVGARSAVFAPCVNLGLVIVDEEHEDTYKSGDRIGYDAREVALFRGKTENAAVLLASATPSVEDYYRAKCGMYRLCAMKNRYNGVKLPETIVADMREELRQGNRSPFSEVLKKEINRNLIMGEQTILFLNRRGYSTFVSCRSCGHVEMCENCNISMTYHLSGNYLMCHYCGHRKKMPDVCPECGSSGIRGFGTGTQKIEEKLSEEFESASVIRMDIDTTGARDSHEKILDSFQNDGIDILLGTQMVSKGLDFKNVSLVGVLAADQLLNMGDYKAAERTFDLITQVCGRSGRGDKRGRAVIQTYMPENPTIGYASRQDYLGFFNEEIELRRALCYPPFCDIVNVTVTGSDEEGVKSCAAKLFSEVSEKIGNKKNVTLYRAAPCHIDKIKSKYRWHFWFKCILNKEISTILKEIMENEKKQSVSVMLNPVSI